MAFNPMMQNLSQSRFAPIKNMMNIIRSSGNPQMMLDQMLAQNPQMQKVNEYIKTNGGDAKTAFYKMAQDMGVDPEDILRQIR